MKEHAFADLYKDYVDRRVEEGRKEGRAEGERKARAEIAAYLRSIGISEEQISRMPGAV